MIWVPLWIVFIGSITAGGAIDDALARKPAWYVACGVLSGIVCALFVAVNFDLLRYGGSGLMMLGLALASGVWLVIEAMIDIRALLRKKTAQSMATLVATIALGLLYIPALVLGAMHGWQLL
jgi:hypothetical protein